MKGYKGFNKSFQCTPNGKVFQYEVGKEYEHDGEVSLCKSGFHFVENPLDVLRFYPPNGKFAEVEGDGDKYPTDGTTKRVAKHLKINKELSLQELIELGVKFTLERADYTNAKNFNSGDQSVAINTGICSVATNTGNQSVALNIGNKSVAINTGYSSVATNTGYNGISINTGYGSIASNTGGYSIASNTGDYSITSNTGGYSVASNIGVQSVTTSNGYQSVATNTGMGGCSVSLGIEGKASGSVGNWLTLAEWGLNKKGMWNRTDVRTVKVDGEKIKADTFYSLKNGEFVEVQN